MNESIPAVSASNNAIRSSSTRSTNASSSSTIQIFGGNNTPSSDIFYSREKSKIIVNGKEIDPTDEKAIEEISQGLPENQKYPFITAVIKSREEQQQKVSTTSPPSKNIAVADTPSVDWSKAFEPETTTVNTVAPAETTFTKLTIPVEQPISPQPAQQIDENLKEAVIITIQPGQILSKVVEKHYGIQGGGNCLEAANQLIFAEGNEKLANNNTVTQNSSNSIKAGEKVVLPPTLSLGSSVYYLKNSPELEKAPRFVPPKPTPAPEHETVSEPAPPPVSATSEPTPAPIKETKPLPTKADKAKTESGTKQELPSTPKDFKEYMNTMIKKKTEETFQEISNEFKTMLGITDTEKTSTDTSTETTPKKHGKITIKFNKKSPED